MAMTSSDVVSVAAPDFLGVWVHDPDDPANTVRQFMYGSRDRTQDGSVESTALQFVGRAYPVYDFGDAQAQQVSMTVLVPFGDTWAADVAYLEALPAARTTICYRDNRGRVVFGVVTSTKTSDELEGTGVGLSVTRVDFSEAVA